MLPDRVSNPGPLTYESGALPIALRGPADFCPFYKLSAGKYAGVVLVRLVGYLGFNLPLRQYFSLYRAVSQREGERDEKR